MKELRCKISPNGEFCIYRLKKFNPASVGVDLSVEETVNNVAAMKAANLIGPQALFRLMELRRGELGDPLIFTTLTNFDNELKPRLYGGNGITPLGKRRIRNGAFILQRDYRKDCLVFFTLTLPSLNDEMMERVCSNWGKVVDEMKRRTLRALKAKGLPTEWVSVTEIQPKRSDREGRPVLHLHGVVCGRSNGKTWAISVEEWKDNWRCSLSSITGTEVSTKHAVSVQPVKKSAEGYLGKYMSKGGAQVEAVKAAGQAHWLPRQWWSMSRTLLDKIKRQTLLLRGADCLFLIEDLAQDTPEFVAFAREIYIEGRDGSKYSVATYGKLYPVGQSLLEYRG